MKKLLTWVIFISLICGFIFFGQKKPVFSASVDELQKKIDEYTKILEGLGNQERDLKSQISLMTTKEQLTRTKISQTQEKIKIAEVEIATLSAKITRLDNSLDYISKVFISRINLTYKMGLIDPFTLLFSSKNIGEFLAKYKYLKVVQLHDRSLLLSMEETKVNYDEQKQIKEKIQQQLTLLKKQLELEKVALGGQINDRKRLLDETKGKESEYQKLLAVTRDELEAIQQIIAGKGEETEVGKVDQGQRIANVIYGASPCSTGTHLHFEVREDNQVKNPFSFLKNINLVDRSGGDSHQSSGNWEWPLNEPIEFNQGYGANTSAIRSRIVWYNFHSGIDIAAGDRTIKAVKTGKLYQGGVKCGSGTLRYVRVRHDEGNIDTYYLHVNY